MRSERSSEGPGGGAGATNSECGAGGLAVGSKLWVRKGPVPGTPPAFTDVPEGNLRLQVDLPNLTIIGALNIDNLR